MGIRQPLRAALLALGLLLCTGCVAGLQNAVGVYSPVGLVLNTAASRSSYGVAQSQGLRVPVVPAVALIASYSAPAQVNMDATTLGSKRGRGEVIFIRDPLFTTLTIFSSGEDDLRTIAQNAGITKVNHVDYQLLSVLGVFVRLELIVYGD